MSLKIMVVDDEARSLNLMRSVATVMGHSVLAFEDRQAAGEQGDAERFDVAFVGMRLAEFDGVELANRIRRSKTSPSVFASAQSQNRVQLKESIMNRRTVAICV